MTGLNLTSVTSVLAGAIPANIAAPGITGAPQVGLALTATNGAWANSPTNFAYQWQREGSNIAGAMSPNYTPVSADLASLITVQVTASNAIGNSPSARNIVPGPNVGLVNVMPLGDSITQGGNSLGGYREPLWYLLQTDNYNIAYVGSGNSNGTADFPFQNHEGHTGYTISGSGAGGTTNLKYGIDTFNWFNAAPDVILLQIGINDFLHSRTNAQADTDYRALIDDILVRLPNVKIVCGTLVQFNIWADTFNVNLPALVAAKGPRVSFVDLRAVLTSSDLLGDNINLNQGGYNKIAAVWKTGVEAAVAAPAVTVGPVMGTTVFYVSQTTGDDSWDGTAPAFVSGTTGPWKTLAKVNAQPFGAGTSILFKRGDTWRDGSGGTLSGLKTARLVPNAGATGNPNIYDAYGTGPNPMFLGSVAASQTTDWTNTSGNIWTSNSVFAPVGGVNGQPVEDANDVGLVTWGPYPNRSVGSMVDLPGQSDASLTTQGKWLFNTTDWKVHIYSVGNPATAMPGLELSLGADVINGGFNYNYNIQNISVFNSGGHGFTSGECDRVTIRDCIFGWNGGGNLNGGGTRYGNGIQFTGHSTNVLIERCWIFESYEGNISIGESVNPGLFGNIIIRNNVSYNSPALIALIVTTSGSTATTFSVYNNTCANPAGNANRPPGNVNNHTCLNIRGVAPTVYYRVKNNSFTYGGIGFAIDSYAWGQGLAQFDYNNWNMANPVHDWVNALDTETIVQWAAAYSPAAETHGLLQTAPAYVDYTLGEVDPTKLAPIAGSPLVGSGVNLTSVGVVWDYNKNQRPAIGACTIGAFELAAVGGVDAGLNLALAVGGGSIPVSG